MSNARTQTLQGRRVYTPSQLNNEAQVVLEEAFGSLWIEGELSNLSRPASGHWYFTIKDSRAQLRCAMFRGRNQRLRFQPRDGMQLLLRGRLSLYVARGDYQCIVEHMEPAGEGALRLAFEQLRARLEAEGLFAEERKRPLPALPRRIALVTSATGAAIRDLMEVSGRRWPLAELLVLPVAVQGQAAETDIVGAFRRLDALIAVGSPLAPDLVITGRGGGSLEDLQAFNSESVARAIAACGVPVISAVGHETDYTIADFVADRRAPTPSAAAELATPDRMDWFASLSAGGQELAGAMQRRIHREAVQLGHLRRRLRHPGHLLRDRAQRLDEIDARLRRQWRGQQRLRDERLAHLRGRLQQASPRARLARDARHLDALRQRLLRGRGPLLPGGTRSLALDALRRRLVQHVTARLGAARQRQAAATGRLDALSPLQVLQRGYAILSRTEGDAEAVIRDARQLEVGETLRARLARGRLDLTVTGIEPPEETS